MSSGKPFRIDFKGKEFLLKCYLKELPVDLAGLLFSIKGFSKKLTWFFAGFCSGIGWKGGVWELAIVFFKTSYSSVLLLSQFLLNVEV